MPSKRETHDNIVVLIPLVLLAGLAIFAIVWFVWLDKSEFIPIAGGTSLELPGGFYLASNRSNLCNEETGDIYASDVQSYAVEDDWIVGKQNNGWFIVNWKTREYFRYEHKWEYEKKLRDLGFTKKPRLTSP